MAASAIWPGGKSSTASVRSNKPAALAAESRARASCSSLIRRRPSSRGADSLLLLPSSPPPIEDLSTPAALPFRAAPPAAPPPLPFTLRFPLASPAVGVRSPPLTPLLLGPAAERQLARSRKKPSNGRSGLCAMRSNRSPYRASSNIHNQQVCNHQGLNIQSCLRLSPHAS